MLGRTSGLMSNLFVRTLFAEVKNASPAQDEQQDRSKKRHLVGGGGGWIAE